MLDFSHIFISFPVLETERFQLRAMHEDDAPAIFRILSDERVSRYFGSPPMTDPAAASRRVQRTQAAFAAHEGIRWAIVPREGGAFIGSCGFWRLIPEHHRAEIGYELAPEWWSQGVMTEVLRIIIAYGFATMRLHSAEAQIHPDNIGSRRVLEKVGFVQEGYFRQSYYEPHHSEFTDAAVFSLLASEWQPPE